MADDLLSKIKVLVYRRSSIKRKITISLNQIQVSGDEGDRLACHELLMVEYA